MSPSRHRKATVARAALIVALGLTFAGEARAQDRADRPLIVGSEVDYPPFATGTTDQTAGGFTVELWRAVAAEHGLAYRLRVRPFRQLLDEFRAGQIDVMINLAQSPDRRAFADFSVPHVVVHGAVFVRTGGPPIHAEADLAGRSILVIDADLAHDYAVARGWGPQLVLVADAAEGLRRLAAGEHDAMLLGKLAGLQTIRRLALRNVKALDAKAGFSQKFSFAVREGNSELLAKINEGLSVAKSSGAYDSLYETWFGVFEPRPAAPLRDLWRYVGPVATGLAIVMGLLLVRGHERRKGQRRLRDSEERLRLAMAAAHQGLYDVDVDTGEYVVSPEYATMLGHDPATFRETRAAWRERLHPDDRERVDAAFADHPAERVLEYRVEYRQRTVEGRWIWVRSVGRLTRAAADGRPLRLVGTHTDITTRKVAEEALERSEERFRTLTECAPVLIYLTDARGDYVYVNRRWCEAGGLTPEEAAGQGWVRALHEDDRATIGEAWQRSVDSGGAWGAEYRFVNRAGVVTWVYGTAAPIRATDGAIVGYVGTSTDITERRQAALQRELFERNLRETQKLESLGVLAGGIAHDFNNLLTTILGNAGIARLALPPAASAVHECLDQISETAVRAADLCAQMLAYSGRGRFVIEPVDLGQLVQQTTQMLQVSVSKKATLRFHLEPGLPPVEMDVTQIRQVLMNLVINASEAIDDAGGFIDIAIRRVQVEAGSVADALPTPGLPPGSYVSLEVSDTGCGMSAEIQDNIFEPFFTTKFTGRGLGLAAVLGIVRGHRGALKVTSAPGVGTTFTVLLPPAPAATGEAIASPQVVDRLWRGTGTVLVVDDEAAMRSTLARMLRIMGLASVVAANGKEGLEIFRARPDRFALVLLDLTMPDMDGEEAFAELQRLDPEVRVILMSGFNAQDVLVRFPADRLASFLQKPFTVEALSATLKDVLGRRPPAQAAAPTGR